MSDVAEAAFATPVDALAAVSPFALLRVATLPYEALERMRPARTIALLDAVDAAQAQMAALRAVVEDALFAVVPRLDHDGPGRRAALELRRDVHNGRSPAAKFAAAAPSIAAALEPPERDVFERWLDAERAARTALEAAEAALDDERQTVLRPALRAPLDDPAFVRALGLANPMVFRNARAERGLPKKRRAETLEASLLAYVARAAAKTSPFSSFLLMAPVGVALDGAATFADLEACVRHDHARVNRGIFARLGRLAALADARCDAVALRRNETLRRVDDQRVEGLYDREIVLARRPWREQRHAVLRLHPRIVAALLDGPAEALWSAWRARLGAAGIEGAAAEAFVEKLVERGMLRLPPSSDTYDELPGRSLAQQLRAGTSPAATALAPAVELRHGRDGGAGV